MSVWYYMDMDLIILKEDWLGMTTLTSALGQGTYAPGEWEHKNLIYIGRFD